MPYASHAGEQKAGLLDEAEAAWLNAITLEPNLSPSLASLGHLAGAAGDIERVGGHRLSNAEMGDEAYTMFSLLV